MFFRLVVGLVAATSLAAQPLGTLAEDTFADGNRSGQTPPTSIAWYTSSGSSNFTASTGMATQSVSSSRTIVASFTPPGSPAELAVGESLIVELALDFTGFDSAATGTNFHLGLYESIANPNASSGTGFSTVGSPNTQARVSGDFASNNPGSNVFLLYRGYVATTHARGVAVDAPVSFRSRTLNHASLIGSADASVALPLDSPSASLPVAINTGYLATLTIDRTEDGVRMAYTLSRESDGAFIMGHAVTDPLATHTRFDTIGIWLGKNSSSATYSLRLRRATVIHQETEPPAAVTITSAPRAQVVGVGEAVSFAVTVEGTPPYSFQWLKDNTPIDGATSADLHLASAGLGAAGDYAVRVTNAAGSVTSPAATLVVSADPLPPRVLVAPASRSTVAGGSATFSVQATGTGPLHYQWSRDGVDLPAGTSATLTLSGVTEAAIGLYRVRVSNAAAVVVSAPATLNLVSAGALFVAPDGVEGNPGTIDQPTTLPAAIALVAPGGTIWVRGGTYVYNTQITFARHLGGNAESGRTKVFAYGDEKPLFDFFTQPYGKTSQVSNPRGFQINGHYWHLRGLEIAGAADNGIYVCGNHNIIERCITRHNRDTGLQIGRASSTMGPAEWPSHNLILNCDSHDNYDSAPNSGENADGFAAKLTSGPGNVFIGCVARNNIDDGWDLYTKSETGPIGSVVIDQCLAYRNGTLSNGFVNTSGDKNGFKLGGEKIPVVHQVTRSMAFENGKNGFTWNSNPAAIIMVNNTAWDNVQGNYKLDLPGPIFRNLLSFYTVGKGQNDRYGGNSGAPTGPTNCFWFNGSSSRGPSINDNGLSVSPASFRSLDPSLIRRRADGSLDLGDFARLVAGSPLLNVGELGPWPEPDLLAFDPETSFAGLPDLGATELWAAAQAPVIAAHPQPLVAPLGTTATFSIASDAGPGAGYQWYKDAQLLMGQDSPALVLADLDEADSGNYWVRITNDAGFTDSLAASLEVLQPRAAWRITSFGELATIDAIAGDFADADGDGFANLLEYALGRSPTARTFGAPVGFEVVSVDEADYLLATFNRNPAASDVRLTVDFSADLKAWIEVDPFGPLGLGSFVRNGSQTVLVRAPDTLANGYQFVRLTAHRLTENQ